MVFSKSKPYYYLKKSFDFRYISNNSITKKYKFLVVKYCKNSDLRLEENKFTYGITITKKFGNAVSRNLLKRRLKFIINSYPQINDLENLAISIYPKFNAKNANFILLKKEVDKILNDVKNLTLN
ncbi:MAG: ribonuclease P protein component [Rickettsiales bacterium]|nr:ribonuclease P protein component [Rickettsiales bacterium]